MALATSLGARLLPDAERSPADVPFTVIPLGSTTRSGLPKNMQQRVADSVSLSAAASSEAALGAVFESSTYGVAQIVDPAASRQTQSSLGIGSSQTTSTESLEALAQRCVAMACLLICKGRILP